MADSSDQHLRNVSSIIVEECLCCCGSKLLQTLGSAQHGWQPHAHFFPLTVDGVFGAFPASRSCRLMGSYLNACFPSVPVFSRRRITHFFSAGACASLLVYFVYLCLLFLLVGFSFLFFFAPLCTFARSCYGSPSRTSDILYQLKTHRRAPTEVREQTLP